MGLTGRPRIQKLLRVESGTRIPAILWIVGLAGTLLTLTYASAFMPARYNVFMTGGIAVIRGLIFLFILMVDYPFKGELSIGNGPDRCVTCHLFKNLIRCALVPSIPKRLKRITTIACPDGMDDSGIRNA